MAHYIGLEISVETPGAKPAGKIRAAVVRKRWSRLEIVETVEENFSDFDSMTAVLKGIASAFAQYRAAWIVGIAHGEFSFRRMEFPFKNARAVKAALPAAMESEIPLSADDMECSSIFLPSTGEGATVLACAIAKERLALYLNALKEAGIGAGVITPSSAALLSLYRHVMRHSESDEAELLIDAGKSQIQLCLLREDGFIDFLSDEADAVNAERFLASAGVSAVRVRVGGPNAGGFYLPFGERDDSWKEEVEGAFGGGNTEEAHRYTIPLGLAARGFGQRVFSDDGGEGYDFSPPPASSKMLSSLRFAVAGAVVCVMLWTGSLAYGNYVKGDTLARNKAEIRRAFELALPGKRMVKPVFQLKQELEKLGRRLRSTGVGEEGRVDFLWVLSQISSGMPEGTKVEVDELIFTAENVTVQGKTDTFESVNAIREALAGITQFKNVEIADSRVAVESGRVSFKLRISL